MSKKTIVFATAAYSLAETQRMTQIAAEVESNGVFNALVVHYAPRELKHSFAKIIEDRGLKEKILKPYVTKELADYIFAVDRGEKAGALLPDSVLKERIKTETGFLQTADIACVVTGFCLSFYYSCRIMDIPIVSVYSGSFNWWFSRGQKERRLPDMMSSGIFKIMPKKLGFAMMNWFSYKYSGMFRKGNTLLKKRGKAPFKSIMDFLGGDYYFMSDIPEYIPIKDLPENVFYTGALIGRLDADIPDAALRAREFADSRKWPLIYMSMGSSGRPKFIKKCLEIFRGEEFAVISPMKTMIGELTVKGFRPPENVFLCDWLPADKVNPMCDAALIHGGQGTVYTAILSRTPFCAIGNGNMEQEFNAEAAAAGGFAKLFRRTSVKPAQLISELKELLADSEAKRKIEKMAELLERPEWNGEKRAAKTLERLFGGDKE